MRVESWLRNQGATDAHPLVLFGESAANPHGRPGPRVLRAGDVVCADLSACLDGYWGDLTRCATVGFASEWATQAWEVVREAQSAAIAAARPGIPARDVDRAQRVVVESRPDLGECLHGAGHAIGLAVHEPPFLVPRTESPLEEGMVLAIEPMVAMGRPDVRVLSDGWTAVTRDGSLAAHFEHTVAVTGDGPLVLTRRPDAAAQKRAS